MALTPGASLKDWAHFTSLGLMADLLPVVSDPTVSISPLSKMRALGKTPSIINAQGMAAGVPAWTSRLSDEQDLARWSKDSRLGISLQTRLVRAIDVDIEDEDVAAQVRLVLNTLYDLPSRTRSNSSKFLLLFKYEGELFKRRFDTHGGAIELLATGQQFIAVGTHPSGVRYEWPDGLPLEVPTLTLAQLDALWTHLEVLFATSASVSLTKTRKGEVLNAAIESDRIAQHLTANHWVYASSKDGRLDIRCPFEGEHTSPSSESATSYFCANTGGFARGHFRCLHSHCVSRSDEAFLEAVGYEALDFEDYTHDDFSPVTNPFTPVHISQFHPKRGARYHIKGVLPATEMVMLFGPPSGGKSFIALDMGLSISRGVSWRDLRVRQGRVVYIAAEGAAGVDDRLTAYCEYHGVKRDDVDLFIIPHAPNLMLAPVTKQLIDAVVSFSPSLIILDTWARVTSGGDENSAKDMGIALANCKRLHLSTSATVMIIHHTGKDAEKGARGSSVFLGAADTMLEIRRNADERVLTVTKQKDGVEGLEFGFKLNVMVLGKDEDGDEYTSCVVVPANVTVTEINLSKYERILYNAVREGAGLDGLAPDVNTVITLGSAQLPYDEKVDKRDRRGELLSRSYRKCIDKKQLFEVEGRVYVDSPLV